jgi:endonuclease/exonuclease/phosphatase family metal-dependent hydrolase
MQRIRLVTFNIAHGRGLMPIQGMTSARKIRMNLRKIARLLTELKPDVVALQEIDECSRWAGNFDHLDYLRSFVDLPHAVFGINNRRKGLLNLSYGNAFLSKHPITASETVVFGQSQVGEKGFLFAEFDIGGLCVPIVNLHLHYGSRRHRFRQLDRLLAYLKEQSRDKRTGAILSPIICGDFNNQGTHREDATSSLLSHLFDYDDYVLHPQSGRTFPSPFPSRLLDFVFLPPGCADVESEVVKSLLSDHRPVRVDFTLGLTRSGLPAAGDGRGDATEAGTGRRHSVPPRASPPLWTGRSGAGVPPGA